MGKDRPALIILNYWDMDPTPEEFIEARKTTSLTDLAEKNGLESQNLLVGIEAVKACNRPPPLVWFDSEYASVSDDKEDIKEWMRGRNKTFTARDLITDTWFVVGYEADFVIYLGSGNVSAFMSRCRGQFVHIE